MAAQEKARAIFDAEQCGSAVDVRSDENAARPAEDIAQCEGLIVSQQGLHLFRAHFDHLLSTGFVS